MVACFIWENKIFFANVGDSRAYFFKNPYLWRVTEDHSVLNEQMKKGLIKEQDAISLVDTNVITRSIGFISEVKVDLFQKDISPEDIFLLCSDGLNEMLTDQEVCEVMKNYSTEALVEQLIKRSLDAGGNDNVSVIVIVP